MPYTEDFDDFFDEWATTMIVHPRSSDEASVLVIFDADHVELEGSGIVAIDTVMPMVTCKTSDVESNNIEYNTLVRISGGDYQVVGLRQDGTGIHQLLLEAQ